MPATNPFREESLDMPCPSCGQTLTEVISRLEESPTLTCSACAAEVQIDGQELREEMMRLDEELARAASEVPEPQT